MLRFLLKPAAVAFGLFAAAGPAAADDARHLGRYDPADDRADTDPVNHRYRYGFYPGGGFYNRGFYGGYYGGFHRGYYGGYRPWYGGGFNYAPRFYAQSFYYPRPFYGYGYSSYYYNSFGYGGGFCPIGGGVGAASGIGMTLALRPGGEPVQPASRNDPLYKQRQLEREAMLPSPFVDDQRGGTFRYDGGPANPVPQPSPDAGELPIKPLDLRPRPTDVLNISYPPKPAAARPAHKYPAYGDK